MTIVISAIRQLLSSGYLAHDRELSNRPIMKGVAYGQN